MVAYRADRGGDGMGGEVDEDFYNFAVYLEEKGFEHIGSGSFRDVYVRKSIVIKIPNVGDGVIDNRVEAAAWRKYKSQPTDLGIHLAPCRLLPNGCLMMVFIEKLNAWDMPLWAKKIDGAQVGSYKGKTVAFDYALDVTERHVWEEEWQVVSEYFQDEWLDMKPHLRKKATDKDIVCTEKD